MPGEMLLGPLLNYLDNLVPERPDEMKKMEAYASEHRFPIIGPACGFLCYQVARMVNAKNVYELGSGFGYSTAWFAKAVTENGGGKVHHVVWDQKLSDMAKTHLANLGYDDTINYTVGEATEALRNTDEQFDVIFCDIDKEGYPAAIPVVKEKLRKGGVLLVDNMLWQGKIFDDANQEKNTVAIRETTKLLTEDPTWNSSLIPIRDGLMVSFKNN